MSKMKMWEKFLVLLALLTIMLSILLKCLWGINDTGTLVILAFMGILLFVVFLTSAFFPADWRMTEKEKSKIKDMDVYQEKYRKIFISVNFIFSLFSAVLILTLV